MWKGRNLMYISVPQVVSFSTCYIMYVTCTKTNNLHLCHTSWFHPKPWIRKVRTSRGHLLVEKRTILETWYTSYFFRNTTFLFVKIESWNFLASVWFRISWNLKNFQLIRTTFISHRKNVVLILSEWAENLWGFMKS